MLTWMQGAVVRPVAGMTKQDLDYLFDPRANSIGALLLHLAATETYYQMNTRFAAMDGKEIQRGVRELAIALESELRTFRRSGSRARLR